MTHDELARLRDAEDWQKLWLEALPHAEHAARAVSPNGRQDEDAIAEAHMAAGKAVRDWSPLDHAFSTHIDRRVRTAVQDWQRRQLTGGIGSEWTARAGHVAADHISLSTKIDSENDEEEDTLLWMNNLTYADTANVPEGYGDIGAELQREHLDDQIKAYLHGLTPKQMDYMRQIIMNETSLRDYAEAHGEQFLAVRRKTIKVLNRLKQNASNSVMESKGEVDWKSLRSYWYKTARRYPGFWDGLVSTIQGNPVWAQVTGTVWNAWWWKPTLADMPQRTSTLLQKVAAQVSKRRQRLSKRPSNRTIASGKPGTDTASSVQL